MAPTIVVALVHGIGNPRDGDAITHGAGPATLVMVM